MGRDIDNTSLREKYKDDAFGDKRSMTDDYTGNRIFRDNVGLKNKHPSTKLVNGDHCVPINTVEKRYGDLSREQQKSLANDRSNIAFTNESLNKSKREMSNAGYVAKKISEGDPLPAKTAAKMISRQVKSEINMGVNATGMRVDNAINKLFKK